MPENAQSNPASVIFLNRYGITLNLKRYVLIIHLFIHLLLSGGNAGVAVVIVLLHTEGLLSAPACDE